MCRQIFLRLEILLICFVFAGVSVRPLLSNAVHSLEHYLKSQKDGDENGGFHHSHRKSAEGIGISVFSVVFGPTEERLQAEISLKIFDGNASDVRELTGLRDLRLLRQRRRLQLLRLLLLLLPAGRAEGDVLRVADQSFDAGPELARGLVRVETEADYFVVICGRSKRVTSDTSVWRCLPSTYPTISTLCETLVP